MEMRHMRGIFHAVVTVMMVISAVSFAAEKSPLLTAMKTELDRSFAALLHADTVPLYYLSYEVCDVARHDMIAQYGAIVRDEATRERILDIDCRVGSPQLDNTREIRGDFDFFSMFDTGMVRLPLEDNALATRTIIWQHTDDQYKKALERYTKVKTNQQVLVDQQDTSADFSVEKANVYIGEGAAVSFDGAAWRERLKKWSGLFKEYPFITNSTVSLSVTNDNRHFVNSEGDLIETGQPYSRLTVACQATADDGMELSRHEGYDVASPSDFPADSVVTAAIHRLAGELKALLGAPPAEPYSGPAILVNRAAGVFFHEIFGHRIEGHRQKSEMEGQTFARKVGELILPDFIDIYDDPTRPEYDGTFLRGFYRYDDEGVTADPVTVVEKGVLRHFLMSRSPIENFPHSNGHGRREPGNNVVARQGNLIVKSTREYPFDTLVTMLLDECRRQGKPYGLVFYDISGGFTQTGRYGPQAFKVLPLLVYRYYADGRAPEVIRGVDIVGTPLSSFEKIIATGDDYGIFNGTCGAESGMVPVSAISPSLLVSQMEIEKKMKEQEKPPILPPPYQPKNPQGVR